MPGSPIRSLRPLSTLELIDEAFDLFKRSGLAALAITCMAHVPSWVLFGLLNESTLLGFSLAVAVLVAPVVAFAAMTKLQYERYLHNPCSVTDAWRAVWRRGFPILATAVLAGVALSLGVAALVLPSLLLYVGFFPLWPVIMVEDAYYLRALRRSWHLASGSFGRVLGVVLLAAVPYALLAGLMTAAALSPPDASSGSDSTHLSVTEDLMMGIIVGVMFALLPLAATTLSVVLYVDLRVRREGFDIERMAHSAGLGGVPGPEDAPAPVEDAPGA